MLIDLSIQNFAIIEDLNLEFDGGLSVISGETGAGKSITVDALSYILGGKADVAAIAHGKDQCTLTATFDVTYIPKAKAWLDEQSIEHSDNLCIIRRVITREGRSRNFINSQTMPLHALKTLGEWLIDIHGQHAHQSLVKEQHQRILVDQYADTEVPVQNLSKLTKTIQTLSQKLVQLNNQDASLRERADFLHFQLQEFSTLKPEQHEWTRITEQHDYLSSFEERLSLTQECLSYLNDDDYGINQQLTKLHDRLHGLAKKNQKFNELAEMISNACILCNEAENDLNRMNDAENLDPNELQKVESRMRELNDLARKHRVEPEALTQKQQELEAELAGLSLSEEAQRALEQELSALKAQWQQQAKAISQQRTKAVHVLNKAISAAMQTLAMTGGIFEAKLFPVEGIHSFGQERIEFFVSANPGSPLQPLGKVASGGELARISLSISVILSMKSALPTLIFDEVDTGVGGAVAEMIGKHLQTLSQGRQVLCVTHLPQVASFGHQHFVVLKNKESDTTQTAIKKLDAKTRVEEIARMLGGVKLTEATFEHAREMLATNSGGCDVS